MLNFFKKRFALSDKGARDFRKGIFFSIIFNLALMLPAMYVFMFLDGYLRPLLESSNETQMGIWYFLILGLAFVLVAWFAARLQYRNTYTPVYSESANRRVAIAEKLRKLPLAFFGQKDLADLTSTIMADNTELERTFSHAVPQLFASIISMLLISVGLFACDWRLTLALFWVVPLAAGIILISKKMQIKNNQKIYDQKRVVSDFIQEGLEMVAEIKSYNNEKKYISDLNQKLDDYEQKLTNGELKTAVFLNSAQSMLQLGLVSVILVGAYLLAQNELNLFTYLAFLIVASRIYDPINEVLNFLAALFHLDIPIKRMNEMQNLATQKGRTDFVPKSYDVVFEQVEFAYEAGKKVMAGVSFTAKQGEITALIGPSGGGKTTATKLAARFWDINSGKITLGGQDISEIDPETLLKYYSIVFQDVVLFNTSIKENIRIGKHDATDKEIMRVAKLARCDEFVKKMPKGYDTIIGENGETLSGGEKQRISIARALLKDAPIILLDESTASLDVENETKIQAGISELIKHKTVLIIAHRMRTVAHADKIVVLKDGKVAESGRPAELKKLNGIFAKMCVVQG